MNIDIDKAYAFNTLLKIYERFGENSYIRETEHGYHIKIPVECSIDNFIYCLVIRKEFDELLINEIELRLAKLLIWYVEQLDQSSEG